MSGTLSVKAKTWLAAAGCVIVPALAAVIAGAYGQTLELNLLLPVSLTLFTFCAIPLFLTGLDAYKDKLRRAYKLIIAGIVLYGIGQVQFPMIALFHLEALANTGLVVVPYLLSSIFIFWGVRRFGKLMQLRGIWFSRIGVVVLGLVWAVLITLPPHAANAYPEQSLDTSLALNNFCGMFLFFSMMGLIKVKQAAAARYRDSLGWLIASLAVLVFATIHYPVSTILLPSTHWYSGWPQYISSIIGAMLFLRAGYAFHQINAPRAAAAQAGNPIDVIGYVAGLASNPSEIDQSLDKLRTITATLSSSSAKLSAKQESELTNLYQQLEKYLVEKEPLQKFTVADLRETIRTRFDFNKSTSSTFSKLFTS